MNRSQKGTAALALIIAVWAGAITLPKYFGEQAFAATDTVIGSVLSK